MAIKRYVFTALAISACAAWAAVEICTEDAVANGPEFAEAQRFAAVSPEINAKVGSVEQLSLKPFSVHGIWFDASGRERFACAVKGRDGQATLVVEMWHGAGPWMVTAAALDGVRILIPGRAI